jgi:hypothetical protein
MTGLTAVSELVPGDRFLNGGKEVIVHDTYLIGTDLYDIYYEDGRADFAVPGDLMIDLTNDPEDAEELVDCD